MNYQVIMTAVLKDLAITSVPVSAADIAEEMGYKVRLMRHHDPEFAASIRIAEKLIEVSEAMPPVLRNSAIAHQLGVIIDDLDWLNSPHYTALTRSQLVEALSGASHVPNPNACAGMFAAHLLIPEFVFAEGEPSVDELMELARVPRALAAQRLRARTTAE